MDTSAEQTDAPAGRKKRRRGVLRRIGTVVAVLLIAAGLAAGVTALVWPDQVQEAYGEAQIAIGEWRMEVTNEVPSAQLGASGGKGELNRCDGTFTEMLSYEREGVPPVWAAHNNCGGDVILPLKIGDEINLVSGDTTTLYRVVDIRETPKEWASTEALIGLEGELSLQTCFYGGSDVPMKFVGLEPVGAATTQG